MQELEKILEEIDNLHTKILDDKFACKVTEQEILAIVSAKEIIRKHMDDGWAPVEERLPEVDEDVEEIIEDDDCPEYNVTIRGASESTTLKYSPSGSWFDSNGYVYDVIAWRPLPEPYRPEGAENDYR